MSGMRVTNSRYSRGFTIIEILIVVVIVSLLLMFSIAGYGSQQKRTMINYAIEKIIEMDGFMAQEILKGLTATEAKAKITTAMEDISYKNKKIYTLSVTLKTGTARGYEIVATSVAPGKEILDCGILKLNSLGERSSETNTTCWDGL